MFIKIINTFNNNVLSIDDDSSIIPIFFDDNIQILKEKLFLMNSQFIPEFVKITINNNIITNNNLIYTYTYISDSNFNLNFDFEVNIFVSSFLENQNDNIDDYNLNIDEINIIKYLKNDELYENLLEKYFSEKNDLRDALKKKYKIFNNFQYPSNFTTNIINNLSINDINFKINDPSITNQSFIKLYDIFNLLELNYNIPLLALNNKITNSTIPQIKIYNNILEIIPDKEIKKWILNENKSKNISTYKNIKGLMIKSRLEQENVYLTINLLANGEIYIHFYYTQYDKYNNTPFNDIIDIILLNVNNIISKINLLNVFYHSKRLNLVTKSMLSIVNSDVNINTTFSLNKNKFIDLLNKKIINEIFERNIIKDENIISLNYKKFYKNNDIKNININISNNNIIIFKIPNLFLTYVIISSLYLLYLLINKNESESTIATKIKSNKKVLKELGIEFDPKQCQSIRQPNVVSNTTQVQKDSYIIYKNKKYACNNPDYPFPGFTNSDIVCCFKTNQIGQLNYVRNINPDSLTIQVQPSNFKIKIEHNNTSITTYLIKVVSEYRNNFNENNSFPRFYYLAPSDNYPTLHPIRNQTLIQELNETTNDIDIWLNPISLNNIIYPNSKVNCKNPPNLNNITDDINSPCSIYKKYPFFRYNNKSIPCCYDKFTENINIKEKNNKQSYIIKSSKHLLNPNRLGLLPTILHNLFINLNNKYEYYRKGVIQDNKFSLIYAILTSLSDNSNHISFLNNMKTYILNNSSFFNMINNGDIVHKYKNINSYISSFYTKINFNEIIELIENIINKNIIILETIDNDKENIKIVCRFKNLNIQKSRPFILLLKSSNFYEVIIQFTNNNEIIDFDYNNPIIQFLLTFYSKTCVQITNYPEKYGEFINNVFYPFQPYLEANNIINLLKNDKNYGPITSQISNNSHKINYIVTSKNHIIPIFETGIIGNLPVSSINEIPLLSYNSYITFINYLNTNYQLNISILAFLDSDSPNIYGLLTNYGGIIPFSDKLENFNHLSKLNYRFYPLIDKHISKNKNNLFTSFSNQKNSFTDNIYNIKKQLGNFFSTNLNIKNEILNIIKDKISNQQKIQHIFFILHKFFDINSTNKLFYSHIINEMIQDNIENLVLNNIIISNTFINSDNESVLLNINDIKKWITNFTSN